MNDGTLPEQKKKIVGIHEKFVLWFQKKTQERSKASWI